MATKGIQFPRRWYGGMISANLEVIWAMSGNPVPIERPHRTVTIKKGVLAGNALDFNVVACEGSSSLAVKDFRHTYSYQRAEILGQSCHFY